MARIGGRASKVNLPTRLALTDPARTPDPFALLATLTAGSGLIWRAYDVTLTRKNICALEQAARTKGVTLLIASAPADTRKSRGRNQHLAAHRLKTTYADHLRTHPHTIITSAAHSAPEIIAAARAGVDAVLISPVFATQSHRGAKPLGPVRFAALTRLARCHGLLAYALGGLTSNQKIRRLGGSADGIAGIGLFTQA